MNKETEYRLEELTKVYADPLYFLKYVKIQEPGELAADYVLWEHLVDFYKALNDYKFIALVKAKQIGISWALAIQALWEIYTIPGWSVLEISKGMVESQDLLMKSRVVYQNLPEWMKVYTLEPNSSEQFGFKENRSVIQAFPSTESAGLGKTAGRVIHDEADFHELFKVNLGHTKATVADDPRRKLACVSTVDKTKPDSYFKELWKAAEGSGYPEQGANGFKALFYGVFARPDRDQSFYDALVKENESTLWVVEANYPRTAEEALSPLSATSCFNKDVLKRLWDNTREPETRQGFIHIFSPPRVGVRYVAGVDVGEGVGLDYSVCTIIGKQGLDAEVAAVIYTNTLGTDLFAYETVNLCKEYFNCLLGIENNSLGIAVTSKVQELGYTNLYSSEADKKREKHQDITGKEKVGWNTNASNKYTGTVQLIASINNGSLITKFKPQVQEMMDYQWVKGHPEPTGRTHGDTVMSLMIADEMLKRARGKVEASYYVHGVKIW